MTVSCLNEKLAYLFLGEFQTYAYYPFLRITVNIHFTELCTGRMHLTMRHFTSWVLLIVNHQRPPTKSVSRSMFAVYTVRGIVPNHRIDSSTYVSQVRASECESLRMMRIDQNAAAAAAADANDNSCRRRSVQVPAAAAAAL